jgi:hypothetical protein
VKFTEAPVHGTMHWRPTRTTSGSGGAPGEPAVITVTRCPSRRSARLVAATFSVTPPKWG